MRTAMAVGLGFLFLMATSVGAQDPTTVTKGTPVPKANEFEGAYTIDSGEQDGQQLLEDRVKGSTVRITGDTIVVADKDNNEVYVAKYDLVTTQKPAKIIMTDAGGPRGRKGQKAQGIIAKDEDKVMLCYAYEGGIVPTSFKTKPGEKQLCFTLKKKDTK